MQIWLKSYKVGAYILIELLLICSVFINFDQTLFWYLVMTAEYRNINGAWKGEVTRFCYNLLEVY